METNEHEKLKNCISNRSYRTYEEWKQALAGLNLKCADSSYRTYEEWKHHIGYYAVRYYVIVLTVPMRNGNFHKFFDL